jgi:hypothetical protein
MLGAFFVKLSFISAFFVFPASSDTLIDNVHSSDIIVHEGMIFQFSDISILQFLLLLSLRDNAKISQI